MYNIICDKCNKDSLKPKYIKAHDQKLSHFDI